ncbi:hypothetical protein KJ815_04010, partial [bacterium]|nr:hypothetical protein [bacterium]
MAEWGNGTGARNPVDMDSNGYKLKVRNTSGAYSESDWRVDIEDTAASARALRLDGNICLKRGTRVCGYVRADASDQDPNVNWLKINSEGGDPDLQIGNGLTTQSGNRVKIRGKNISIGAALDEQYRVGIAGSVLVGPSEGALEAMRVDGTLVVDDAIKVPLIDATGVDHVLNIGTMQAGQVIIGRTGETASVNGHLYANAGAEIIGSLGASQDISAEGTVFGNTLQGNSLDVDGPADIAENLAIHGVVTTDLRVAGKTLTEKLDTPAASTLQIGAENANLVTIADMGVETQLLGSLGVQQDADLQGNVLVHGTLTGQGLITANTLQGSALDVNGPADIAENLIVGGQTTLHNDLTVQQVYGQPPANIHATGCITADMVLYGAELSVSNNATVGGDLLVSGSVQGATLRGGELDVEDIANVGGDLFAGSVHCENICKFTPDGANFEIATEMEQGVANRPTLSVHHSAGNATALRTQGAVAIDAIGKVLITGETTQNGTLQMTGHDVIIGG